MLIRERITHLMDAYMNAWNTNLCRKVFRIHKRLLSYLVVPLILGCGIMQGYERPKADIHQYWRVEYQEAEALANTAWWENFQDPVLNELIKTALSENKDLRIASARVEEFESRLQATQSDFYPQIYYGGSVSRYQETLERVIPLPEDVDRINYNFQAMLNLNWELDIWGRIHGKTDAARAEVLSTEEARQGVILTLVSAVANSYFELLSLDRQLEISLQTMASRKDSLRLFEGKKKGGQISELELAQVRSAYEQIAILIPILELKIPLQENSLSVLLGRNPGPIKRGKKLLDTLAMPKIPLVIPSDLLVRRPDIRQSEQNLIAANARIKVARTKYFPSISLTGEYGYNSPESSELFETSANMWDASAGVIGSIFTGGRIKGEVRQTEAKYKQLLNDYQNTIQTALREVNDSLISIQKLRELLQIEARHISVLKDYAYFARSSYDAGYSTYLTVLDAERALYGAQIRYIQTQKDLFSAMVNTYNAMGGGWETEATQSEDSTKGK
ncbi:MAG: efflux transporter outer membrane subunit [Thermodesulfobacteriota bacterium]|nr:efflux transporter outer membrane subunit [Thermodesulfobacteriota bacterium]